MMYLNLIDEGGSKLVARGVHRDRNQWPGLVSDSHVLENEELAS